MASKFYETLAQNSSTQVCKDKLMITIPDATHRQHYHVSGRFIVSPQVVESLINAYDASEPISLVAPRKQFDYIHPLLDFDCKDPDVDKYAVAQDIQTILNGTFKNAPSWIPFFRDGSNGIHFAHPGIRIKTSTYANLVQQITPLFKHITSHTIDAPNSFTLPKCGKCAGKEYVYKNEQGDYEDFPWCYDSCEDLRMSRSAVPDIPTTQNSLSTQIVQAVHSVESYIENMVVQCLPTTCTATNALLYCQLYPFESDAYTDAARQVVRCLGDIPMRDVRLACVVDFIMNNDLLVLPGAGPHPIIMSKWIMQHVEYAIQNNHAYLLANVLAFLLPIVSTHNTIFMYYRGEWIRDCKTFMSWSLTALRLFVERSIDLESGKCLWIPDTLFTKSCQTFWNLQRRIVDIQNSNVETQLVVTKDNCVFAPRYKIFLKLPCVYPILDTCVGYTSQQLTELIQGLDIDIRTVLDQCEDLYMGQVSFYQCFNQCNPTDHCVYYFLYYIITFFGFRSNEIKRFINLLQRILFGLTKHIIFIVGASANNGKTGLMKIIYRAFGTYAGIFNQKEIKSTASSETSPDFMKNANKKITLMDEVGGVPLNMNMLKTITSNGMASGRTLYSDTQIINCMTNFMCLGNSRPIVTVDAGIKERLHVFDVNTKFVSNGRSDLDAWAQEPHDHPTHIPVFNIDYDRCALGCLVTLLTVEPFTDVVQTALEEETIQVFIDKYVNLDAKGESIPIHNLIDILKNFATAQDADFDYLYTEFKSRFVHNIDVVRNEYVDISLKGQILPDLF